MQPLSNQQRLHLVNTQQLYSNYVAAHHHTRSHAYGMRWKVVRDVEYLFRERDRRGNGKLLGRRSSKTEQILAAFQDGQPVPFRVPDPRAFALHKAWLSRQPAREPIKKQRDLAQAREVAELVREHMPHLSFDEALASLHGDVRAMRELLNV